MHSVTGHYVHLADDMLAQAADRISSAIQKAMEGQDRENILEADGSSRISRRHLSIAA